MADCCGPPSETPAPGAPMLRLQRRVLGAVLAINLVMFFVEAGAGWRADSIALQADALDFLGDSVNYAIALFVLARSLAWRAGTALAKGAVMFAFGVFLAGASAHHALVGSAPEAAIWNSIATCFHENRCPALGGARFASPTAILVWSATPQDR